MEQLIDSFNKNAAEEVRALITEYKGKELFTIRVFAENKSGERVPTKKGITLQTEQFPRFLKSVERLRGALIAEGVLDQEDFED